MKQSVRPLRRRTVRLPLLATALAVSLTAVADDVRKPAIDPAHLQALEYRLIGPYRGGRVTAVSGVVGERDIFYMGSTGGGVWKSTDAGNTWRNVSDKQFRSGSQQQSRFNVFTFPAAHSQSLKGAPGVLNEAHNSHGSLRCFSCGHRLFLIYHLK